MLRWFRWRACRRWTCVRQRVGLAGCFCLIAVVCIFISLGIFSFIFHEEFIRCSQRDAMDYISSYCQLYKEGVITGSLCQPLCDTHKVRFSDCTNFHAGKRVNMMECSDFCHKGETVSSVLKSPNANASILLKDHPDDWLDLDALKQDSKGHISQIILSFLKTEFTFFPFSSSNVDVLQVMWEENYSQFMRTLEEKRVAYRTIMMLMDQTEFKVGKALETSGIVPRIYGTCGPLYLQEACPPGLLDIPLVSVVRAAWEGSWTQRATTAIQLLNLVQQLEQSFSQVLHLCDVKGSNFGVCRDGSVKLVDADSVFFHHSMLRTFNSSECSTHTDCSFFDCGGWCQLDAGKCYAVITNNNLQSVCSDVLESPLPDLFSLGSLLSGGPPSVASQIEAALQECLVQTSEENGIPMYKPPLSLLTKLTHLLMQSLAEDDGTL